MQASPLTALIEHTLSIQYSNLKRFKAFILEKGKVKQQVVGSKLQTAFKSFSMLSYVIWSMKVFLDTQIEREIFFWNTFRILEISFADYL